VTPAYQGRALQERARTPRPGGRFGRIARVLGAFGLVLALAHLPWDSLRRRFLVVREVRVEGFHYLDAAQVAEAAGIRRGQDLLALDCARARQALLLHPRIERAEVDREFPDRVRIRIVERTPVLLVRHGVPWEIDSSGVLLPPLAQGAAADVPLLTGPDFDAVPAGAHVGSAEVGRGLAWVRALGEPGIQLGGQVSEIDVADDGRTALTLMDGARVLAPPWPPGARTLSALRVVLADLARQGRAARELDLRFSNQVVVRPVETRPRAPGAAAAVAAVAEPEHR